MSESIGDRIRKIERDLRPITKEVRAMEKKGDRPSPARLAEIREYVEGVEPEIERIKATLEAQEGAA